MKNKLISMAACCLAACTMLFQACDDGLDLEYKGNLDLNLLGIKQAAEIMNQKECNLVTALRKAGPGEVEDATDFTYQLNLALYQNKQASQTATVDLVVAADSLTKAISMVGTSSLYDVYTNAELLPSDSYTLSATSMTLPVGSALSEAVQLTVKSQNLIDLAQSAKVNKCYVLPLRIQNSNSYAINGKTSTIMFIFNVTYLDEEAYVPDTDGVPDDHIIDDNMKLMFHDEFNGVGTPDANVWKFEEGFMRNEELQWYCDRNAEMAGDGTLVITGKSERVKNPNYVAGSSDWKLNREYAEYTSSSIITKNFRFRYGTMIVRAKIPTETGAWPAIWTTGTSDDSWCWEWPLGGEIDLLEYYLVGGKPSIHANACWGSDKRWSATWDSYNRPLEEFVSKDSEWTKKYHIWRMDWDETSIRLYLDDELMNEIELSKTNNGTGGLSDWWRGSWRNPFKDAGNDGENFGQQIFLNLALGGNGGTPVVEQFPLYYYIDYVRVYQKAE